jgi:hypothetical protein
MENSRMPDTSTRRRAFAGVIPTLAAAGGLLAGAAALPTPAAAADDWCDIDPPVIVKTPRGRLVTVFANIGAKGLTPALLAELSRITYTVTSTNGGKATKVDMYVTVPRTLLLFGTAPARVKVTSLALGLGTFYGSGTGVSGTPMHVSFVLPVA